jgi:multicomponent Na+:H+ antiporter subunit E
VYLPESLQNIALEDILVMNMQSGRANTALPGMLRAAGIRIALFAALWWALTGGGHDAWIVGMIAIALAVGLSLHLMPPGTRRYSIVGTLGFAGFFVLRSVKAGVQVAAMAVRPRLDLHPAMLDITLRLPEEAQRIFLVGTLSLLPGTLSAGLDGNRLRLHVLDRRMPIEQDVRSAEERIARMFRLELQ